MKLYTLIYTMHIYIGIYVCICVYVLCILSEIKLLRLTMLPMRPIEYITKP